MPSGGDPFPDWQKQWRSVQNWTSNATIDSISYNYGPFGEATAEVTMKMEPGDVMNLMAPEAPVDDSPMSWLRSQVDEICTLGRAA